MNKEEFYRMLDIEEGGDFQYFENIAELFESEETIETSLLYGMVCDVDMEMLEELVEQYFNEITEWVPDGETDFYTLLVNIQRVMSGMIQEIRRDDGDDDISENRMRLTDEIEKFREWYSLTADVDCTNNEDGSGVMLPVRDALMLGREEKLGGDSYSLDFTPAMDYELEEFVMSFADLSGYAE